MTAAPARGGKAGDKRDEEKEWGVWEKFQPAGTKAGVGWGVEVSALKV